MKKSTIKKLVGLACFMAIIIVYFGWRCGWCGVLENSLHDIVGQTKLEKNNIRRVFRV